ncbi:hypothetical protein HYQ46_012715 [Verticillium longisporum]|nr:hypothetical protein HYQ46_012715 [Verticillium longisporum]
MVIPHAGSIANNADHLRVLPSTIISKRKSTKPANQKNLAVPVNIVVVMARGGDQVGHSELPPNKAEWCGAESWPRGAGAGTKKAVPSVLGSEKIKCLRRAQKSCLRSSNHCRSFCMRGNESKQVSLLLSKLSTRALKLCWARFQCPSTRLSLVMPLR